MMRQMPLDTLIRLRGQELDAAEKAFAEVNAREAAAEKKLQRAQQKLLAEQKLASDPAADDMVVEAFSRWLPTARKAIADAREACRQAALDRDCARAALIAARAALKAVRKLEEEQARERARVMQRREQASLDEFALRSFGRT